MKKIEDMTFDEMMDYFTGYFLTELGRGEKVRSIIYMIVTWSMSWKESRDKAKK
jgi:DNA-binding HxlR family transcriptional regulator